MFRVFRSERARDTEEYLTDVDYDFVIERVLALDKFISRFGEQSPNF
jgi:hypothetical protein